MPKYFIESTIVYAEPWHVVVCSTLDATHFLRALMTKFEFHSWYEITDFCMAVGIICWTLKVVPCGFRQQELEHNIGQGLLYRNPTVQFMYRDYQIYEYQRDLLLLSLRGRVALKAGEIV